MTNATKTLGLILFLLVVTLGIMIFTDNSGRSEIFREKLMDFDPNVVNRILIQNSENSSDINLSKLNGSWQVETDLQVYEAANDEVQRILNTLNNLEIVSLITRSEENFSRFNLDSTGTFVSLYNEEDLLDGIIVGNQQAVNRQDYNNYVRKFDENNVFTVDQYLEPMFSTDPDYWRNKSVWRLDENMITQIDIEFDADSSFVIVPENNQWVSGGETLDNNKVERLIQRITDLSAIGFTKNTGGIDNPSYTVRIHMEDGQTKTLAIRTIENSNTFEVQASGYPYLFTVNKSSWDRAVLGGLQALLPDQSP